jgi:hypothetical protein
MRHLFIWAIGLFLVQFAIAADAGWPRQFSSDGQEFTIYQPQVEKWKDNQIEERAAVSVQMPGSSSPVFGVVWIKARTEVDRSTRQVTLQDLSWSRANFPTAKDKQSSFLAALKAQSDVIRTISLERLQANLAITRTEDRRKSADLKNTPPDILYSDQPSLLVLVDGKPVLRQSEAEGYLRIINTHALIVMNQESGVYSLYAGDRWWQSPQLEDGQWKPIKDAQAGEDLEKIKTAAIEQKQVDLLKDEDLIDQVNKGLTPKIYVATQPSELIQTKGSPQFQPVADTQLLYVKNSSDDIFLNTSDQKYYILVSGRWYSSASLEGAWHYVSAKSLPEDFAKIPETHPKGAVLASVPGTEEAKEAVIDNEIPQTATVDRDKAKPEIKYDGDPILKPIEGTPLQYVYNSSTPVIEVNPKSFYSVQNGIWFEGSSAQGPWFAATQVPSVIYTIPPSSPLYYVTYVYVYGSTPRYVYVGYLPGYLGSYVDSDGLVVFGTGYPYQSWVGSYWFGAPFTFGFAVGWGLGWGWGWGFHSAYWGGPLYRPWWGPWGYGWAHGIPPGRVVNVTNIYHSYRPGIIHSFNNPERPVHMNQASTFRSHGGFTGNSRPNNVFADRNGNVYQHGASGWQHLGGGGGGEARSTVPHDLDQERDARARGEQRMQAFNSHSSDSHGGSSRRRNFGGGRR